MGEARIELVAPAPNRFITDDNAALEQQLLDVAQAQLKPEILAHCITDYRNPKPVIMIGRFRIFFIAQSYATARQRDNAREKPQALIISFSAASNHAKAAVDTQHLTGNPTSSF